LAQCPSRLPIQEQAKPYWRLCCWTTAAEFCGRKASAPVCCRATLFIEVAECCLKIIARPSFACSIGNTASSPARNGESQTCLLTRTSQSRRIGGAIATSAVGMIKPADITDQQQFVRDNQVRWWAYPIFEKVRGERVPVGYELELSAVFDSRRQGFHSNGPASSRLFCRLKTLAEKLLPDKLGGTRIDILPFDHSVHLDPNRDLRPRVLLKLQIIHAANYFQPASASEAHCLHELEIALSSLGAVKCR
jgi:hypothetical protein